MTMLPRRSLASTSCLAIASPCICLGMGGLDGKRQEKVWAAVGWRWFGGDQRKRLVGLVSISFYSTSNTPLTAGWYTGSPVQLCQSCCSARCWWIVFYAVHIKSVQFRTYISVQSIYLVVFQHRVGSKHEVNFKWIHGISVQNFLLSCVFYSVLYIIVYSAASSGVKRHLC